MKIGCFAEDNFHYWFLRGLMKRWGLSSQLIKGRYRGAEPSLRRELKNVCKELDMKNCQVFVFMTDADKSNWRERLHQEERRVLDQYQHKTIWGTPIRNIESWMTIDEDYFARFFGINKEQLNVGDRSGIARRIIQDRVEEKLSGTESPTSEERGEAFCAIFCDFIKNAPGNWVEDKSFGKFYEEIRDLSQLNSSWGCSIPNEKDG